MAALSFSDGPHSVCAVHFSLNNPLLTLSLCLSPNSFSDETSRTWALLSPEISRFLFPKRRTDILIYKTDILMYWYTKRRTDILIYKTDILIYKNIQINWKKQVWNDKVLHTEHMHMQTHKSQNNKTILQDYKHRISKISNLWKTVPVEEIGRGMGNKGEK